MLPRELVAVVALAAAARSVACKPNQSSDHQSDPPPQVSASTSAVAHEDEPGHAEVAKRLHPSAAVVAEAKLKTAPVVLEVMATELELPGELVSDPDKTARISSPVAGKIERVTFAEGASVSPRDLLAIIRVPDLADRQATYASAAARSEAARAKQERLKRLVANGISPTQDLDAAKAEAAAADADVNGAAERLSALGVQISAKPGSLIELRSPIAGTVVSRDAVVGQPLDTAHVIATIVDLREVWFLGRVFENDLAQVHLGAAAHVELNAYANEPFVGTIEYVGRQIDPVARTVTARVRLENRGDLLRIGLFGTARIAAGEDQKGAPVLVIPRGAVTEINGKPVVFVHHADGDFELHDIVVGRSALDKVEVLSGLREGEQVVSEGAFTLKSLALRSSFAEEE